MKLLLVPDLHTCVDLGREIAACQARLPADTYDHRVGDALYWHNRMLVDASVCLWEGVARLARSEAPDLVILLGDVVNTNWEENIALAAQQVAALPRPVRMVTGNHDVLLDGPTERLQDALTPDAYAGGLRHEVLDGLGLIYLDLFVHSSTGETRKWMQPGLDEPVDYRAEDVAAALALLDSRPDLPWLILGHFPMTAPDPRLDGPGRKIGWRWPGGSLLAERLTQPGNLVGILCGHQHFAHLQRFAHGFHWTLPPLVEYPCAATLVEWDKGRLRGRTVTVDEALAAASLRERSAAWTSGGPEDNQYD